MISAMMQTAISAGVRAPMSMPMGAWMRSNLPGGMPCSRSNRFEDRAYPAAAADHADVGQGIVQHFEQRIHVILVAAGDEHDVGMPVELARLA